MKKHIKLFIIILSIFLYTPHFLIAQEERPPQNDKDDRKEEGRRGEGRRREGGRREGGRKKGKEMLIKHINQELKLTKEQKDKFWNIYKEYQQKVKAIHQQLRKNHNKIRDSIQFLTKDMKQKIIETELSAREDMIQLEKDLNQSLISVITIDQLLTLKKLESHIKRKMRAHKRKKGGRGHGERYKGDRNGHHPPPPEEDNDSPKGKHDYHDDDD